jgi:tRNA threonylcarbamoyladenosine biosynthesis protein TsaE
MFHGGNLAALRRLASRGHALAPLRTGRHIGFMLARPIATLMLPDLAATHALAAAVAAAMRPGDAILLEGPLGAGKSAFARALLRAATDDAHLDVPSPTFTLVQSYETRRGTVHHFDLWRLDGPGALEELGWDEARTDIVMVEWPDRLGTLAPADALHVTLSHAPDRGAPEARHATLAGWSGRLPGYQ